jgi:hypothetical protein
MEVVVGCFRVEIGGGGVVVRQPARNIGPGGRCCSVRF